MLDSARTATDADRRARRAAAVAVLGCALLASAWALTSPLMTSPDEAAHAIRAVSLAHGDLLGRPFAFANEATGEEAVLFEVAVPAGYRGIETLGGCVADGAPAACMPTLGPADGTILQATAAGAYPPLWYALVGAPSRVLDPTPALYAGRLAQALAGSLVVGAAVWLAARLGSRLAVAATLLGLTPTAVFLLGTLNPNGMEIAASAALWLGVIALVRTPDDRRVAGIAALAAVGTAWSRPLSPLIAVGIVVTALVVSLDADRWAALRASRTARIAAAVAAIGIAGAGVWVAWSGALETFVGRPNPALTTEGAIAQSLAMSEGRLAQLVGVFGTLDLPLPSPMLWLWAAATGAALLAAALVGTWRQRAVLAALVVGTAALPVVAEGLTAPEMGFTWQGRYTIPVAFGIAAVTALTVAHRGHRLPTRLPGLLIAVVAGTVAVVHVAAHLQAASRYGTGRGSALLDHLTDPAWGPPGPDLVVLLAAVAGAVALALTPLVAGPAVRPRPAPARDVRRGGPGGS